VITYLLIITSIVSNYLSLYLLLVNQQVNQINKVTTGVATVFITFVFTHIWLGLDLISSYIYTTYALTFFLFYNYDLRLIKETHWNRYEVSEFIRAALLIGLDPLQVISSLMSKVRS
jgi:hypothetical protein